MGWNGRLGVAAAVAGGIIHAKLHREEDEIERHAKDDFRRRRLELQLFLPKLQVNLLFAHESHIRPLARYPGECQARPPCQLLGAAALNRPCQVRSNRNNGLSSFQVGHGSPVHSWVLITPCLACDCGFLSVSFAQAEPGLPPASCLLPPRRRALQQDAQHPEQKAPLRPPARWQPHSRPRRRNSRLPSNGRLLDHLRYFTRVGSEASLPNACLCQQQ
jgi:hypothetical protein